MVLSVKRMIKVISLFTAPVIQGYRLGTVEVLLFHYPQGAGTKGHHGNLPLYDVYKGRAALLESLVDHFPAGPETPAYSGKIPLHAASACDFIQLKTMQWLANLYPEGLSTAFINRLPLHLALKHVHGTDVTRCLLDGHPESVRIQRRDEGFPLIHIALCESFSTSWTHLYPSQAVFEYPLETVKLLLERGPEVVTKKAGNRLPLHCVYRGTNLEVVPLLMEQYRAGARIQNRNHEIPLHLACSESLNAAPV